ncbi:flagellar export chaperone FliS [Thermocrinis minervae]|uniref:Flagellar secretion chaperone FliS n=1 Tax=Thermocrinis minervae TaxID=381751 RepID=A0A1M6QLQ1_9AQUI|nr:flagellar export chaperone FliS [Thermocrinis minervae]SHK21030.1 flagellar protein FliS [Thermocrinis minervae]
MNAYLENMVMTSNPVRLVILLYEKAIACLESALDISRKREQSPEELKEKLENLGRAQEIITVLDSTLDLEKGGEIAKNLREIYQALSNDLVRLSLQDDPETLEKMIKVLWELKSAWEDVEKEHYGKP